jgi:hypothetical protein
LPSELLLRVPDLVEPNGCSPRRTRVGVARAEMFRRSRSPRLGSARRSQPLFRPSYLAIAAGSPGDLRRRPPAARTGAAERAARLWPVPATIRAAFDE